MLMPAAPGPPVRAKTTQASARPAKVHDAFSPETRRSPPSRRAETTSRAASEPTDGSVRAKATTCSPEATPGSHCFLMSSSPSASRPAVIPASCRNDVTLKSARPISSAATPNDTSALPDPPYSSGMSMPSTPRSPSSLTRSRGNGSLSQRAKSGASLSEAYRRTVSRSSSSSSCQLKSIDLSFALAEGSH